MDKQTEQKYKEFKENPFGSFQTTIDQLKALPEAAQTQLPYFMATKIVLVRAYGSALYDNGLMDQKEYEELMDDKRVRRELFEELSPK
jgi:hypothetical protein